MADVLAHGAAGVRRDVLHRGRFGRRGGDDDRVRQRTVFLELAHDVGDRAPLLADRDVDAFMPVAFWLMIASIATAVLPVWRSPMISSRWPRPIGIIASTDL